MGKSNPVKAVTYVTNGNELGLKSGPHKGSLATHRSSAQPNNIYIRG